MADIQNSTERALIACSLWLHIGFIGAAALAAGLLQLFDGETKWLSALALALCGGVLSAASWRRARTVIEHAERSSTVSVHPWKDTHAQINRVG
jgi:membrane protein implicated in regulation of membrane protease activity